VTEVVVAALTLSVALHICWNLIARRVDPDCHFLWWAILGHLLVLGPLSLPHLFTHADWGGSLPQWIVVSALALSAYFLALGQAYRHAPVNFVYPLSRSAPVLLIGLLGMPVFGEVPGLFGWIGILLTTAGVALLARTAERQDTRHALPWIAVAVAGTTTYSLSDRAAVAALPDLWSAVGYVSVTYAVVFLALTGRNRQRFGRWIPPRRPGAAALAVGATAIGSSYALVIFTMRFIPAAYAVAFTSLGVIVAAGISFAWEREMNDLLPRAGAIALSLLGLGIMGWARL
jgi:drug/metabolite transporter (DMT)-like permease